MNVPAKTSTFRDVAIQNHGGGGKLMPQTFGDVVAFSEIMARAQHAIPKHLRDVPGACLAVTMQALRWEFDPFAVASKSYNVKDIIAYEAQLIAAVVHTRAPLKTRPEYAYTGDGQDRRCTVAAMFDDGIERSYESPRIADILTKNSPLWKADPDQQLGYYSIRAFARRYCPEVILGVYTPEEAEQFRGPDNARDVTPSLADRLAAAKATGQPMEGFSQQHVINEIDGNHKTEAQREAVFTESTSPPAPKASEREPVSTGSGEAGRNDSQASPPNSSPEQAPPSPADPVADTPASDAQPQMALDAGNNSETQESSAAPNNDADGKGGGDDSPSSPPPEFPALPEGWSIVYAAALRRAQKPDSLSKLASQFWNQYQGWAAHKDGPNAETAKAIYNAFANNFGNKDAIEAELREVI